MKLNRELNNVQFWKYICLYEMIKFSDENAIAQLSLKKFPVQVLIFSFSTCA